MRQPSRHARIAFCLAATLIWASQASARTERFRWTHADPSTVDNFRVYWGTQSGNYSSSRDVGLPALDPQGGAFIFDLVVPDTATVYVKVSAWRSGLESALSNERMRPGTTGGSTTPPPPPPPTGARAGITGFALWNAQTNARIDGSFSSGDLISLDATPCTAIEVVGNAYLSVTAPSPGSVAMRMDSGTNTCQTAGVDFENDAPYVWGEEKSGDYQCEPTLTQPGRHVLTATPYDGDNCTGLAGAPVSVSFDVTAPAPAGGSTLGVPGRPFIVP